MKFLSWVKELFDDHASGASMMRMLFAFWMVVFCSILIYVDIKAGTFVPIPEGYVYITGLLAAAKVGQRMWGEVADSSPTNTPPTK